MVKTNKANTSNNKILADNVVDFKNDTVFEDITIFLQRKNIGAKDKTKYESTSKEYERDIERFFKLMKGKGLESLTIKDLAFKRKDVERFQNHLIQMGYKSSTVNRNVNSVRSLYNYFEENTYKFRDNDNEWVYIKASMLNADAVEINDTESYGVFSYDEMKEMLQLALALPNGIEKSLALELASVTSFRISAIVNIKWDNFRKENDTWVVKGVIDKHKENESSISDELYGKLLDMRLKTKTFTDNSVFHLTTKTLERTINTLVEQMGLDAERNLTFHSIKKYGMQQVYMITNGDFLSVKEQGNHESFETSMNYYLQFKKDYSKMPSLLIGKEIDLEPLRSMNKDELIKMIEGLSRSVQYEMLNKINNKYQNVSSC